MPAHFLPRLAMLETYEFFLLQKTCLWEGNIAQKSKGTERWKMLIYGSTINPCAVLGKLLNQAQCQESFQCT